MYAHINIIKIKKFHYLSFIKRCTARSSPTRNLTPSSARNIIWFWSVLVFIVLIKCLLLWFGQLSPGQIRIKWFIMVKLQIEVGNSVALYIRGCWCGTNTQFICNWHQVHRIYAISTSARLFLPAHLSAAASHYIPTSSQLTSRLVSSA